MSFRENILKRLDQLDLIITLSFPAGMAFLTIFDRSPYSIWMAWAGWLFMILYVLFTLVFRNRSIARNEPITRRNTTIHLAIRIFLLIFVTKEFTLDSLQGYFYGSTAGAGLSIVVGLFVAFIHKMTKERQSAKEFGIGLLLLVLCFIGLTTYPFIAEIVRYFGGKEWYQMLYIAGAFLFEFSSVYVIFAKHIQAGDSAIGPDADNPALFGILAIA